MSSDNTISEKAKGKQRAYRMSSDTKLGQEMMNRTQASQEPSKMQLAIRFTDGTPDMLLEMSPEDTGASVISAVRKSIPARV